MRKIILMTALLIAAGSAYAEDDRLFMDSAKVNDDRTIVTLPLYQGHSGNQSVWYIVTEASESNEADKYGVSQVNKLRNARGTAAVQIVSVGSNGSINFPATVNFAPDRVVVPDPDTGFPPQVAIPGAEGEAGYSPLIELPNGVILNASHVANDSGIHDRIVAIDYAAGLVQWELVDGFARDNAVLYITTESSSPVGAALEGVTYAPALNAAPFAGGDGTDSARSSLAAITNGQTGANNPQRQGLNSALMGDGAPLNLLAWTPNQGRYSPLWDVHLSTWAEGENPSLQRDFFDVEDLADDGEITAPDGSPWGPSGFIVNCPVISQLDD